MVQDLREADIRAEMYQGNWKKFGNQLKYADRRGCPIAIIQGSDMKDTHLALLVIAIASGATVLSHVNDSGFWLVSKYLNLSEKQTFRSWTVMTTLLGVTSFLLVLLLALLQKLLLMMIPLLKFKFR